MANITRKATADWSGDLKSGKGGLSADSGYLQDLPYTFASRFQSGDGTNPEELIGAAHAACFNMVVAKELAAKGHAPKALTTSATVRLQEVEGGFRIARIDLALVGEVEGADEATFQAIAESARDHCPVSQLLKPGLDEVTVTATMK